jgi:NAD(P)-dependent dehydrogenase (short-subunit alcohol dehydrogenase family)
MTNKPNPIITDLSGRVAIVTGGASGIGRCMSVTLAQAGAKVTVVDRHVARTTETVAQIQGAGGTAVGVGADITDEAGVEKLVADVATQWGRIDILCNNAGIVDFMVPAAETTTEHWNKMIAVSLTGQFFVTRAVLKHMIAQKSGSIVNTASIAGLRGAGSGIAYTSAKHGMVGFTKHLAWYYASDGIRCNAICPGSTNTNIAEGLDLSHFHAEGWKRLLPVQSASGPPADPQHCANVALFLASDAAKHVNGVIMAVDGGWTAG